MNDTAIHRSATAARNAALTIALCFLIATLEGFDIQALGLAARKLRPEFNLDDSGWGWLSAFSGIGVVFGAYVGGYIADRTGRKPVLIGAVLTFALFTLAMTVAPSTPLIFLTRTLAGAGFGAALPNMMAIAAELSSERRKALVGALIFCGLPAGGGTAALVARLLPPDSSWRLLFVIGGLLPLLLAPALLWGVSETLVRGTAQQQVRAPALQALFQDGRSRPTLLLWLIFLPTLLILYLILNWLPSLITGKQFSPAVSFESTLAFNYASIAGAVLFSLLADRFGTRWPVSLAFAALVVALLQLGGAATHSSTVFYAGACGFFLLGANYALYSIAAAYYPMRMRGTGSGACVAVGRVGSVVGPWLAGQLLHAGMNAAQVIAYMAPLAAVGAVAVFLLSFIPRAAD